MTFSEIERWMKNYNGIELLLWIQITAIHPTNQLFQTRFELLLGILLSIPPESFSCNPLTRTEFITFMRDYERSFSTYFSNFEDEKPFHQLKLIPYFLDGHLYYFFYGVLERPYELLRQFDNLFCIDSLNSINSLFEISLEFQSQIIQKLMQSEEAKIESENIYVPTQQFFDDFSPFFEVKNWQSPFLKEFPALESGIFAPNKENLFDLCIERNLFNALHIHLSDKAYFLIPQVHLEILYGIAHNLIKNASNEKEIKDLMFETFVRRLRKQCSQFFTMPKIIIRIIQLATHQNLSDSVTCAVMVDYNKILLFVAANYSFDINISEQIKETIKEIQNTINNIKKEQEIALIFLDGHGIQVPINEMEFWGFVIFEATTLECEIQLTEITDNKNIWIIDLMDLQGLFEFLPSTLSFLKFLKNDKELLSKVILSKVKVFDVGLMNRFAFYIGNHESYPILGKLPEGIGFDPTGWYSFYHEKLFEKYQDDIFGLIEAEFPNTFNRIGLISKNIYDVINTSNFTCALTVKFETHLIWVNYIVNGFSWLENERRTSRMLAVLYADYIDRLREPLNKFFRSYGFEFSSNYHLDICPISFVERAQLDHLKKYIPKLNKENPVIVETGIIAISLKIHSRIIYDPQYFTDLFAPQENVGEKFCIKQLIESLIHFFDKDTMEEEINRIAKEFIDKNIPTQMRGYSYEPIPTKNPRLADYYKPEDQSGVDIASVNREIAEYIANNGKEPGEYKGEDAKKLNDIIYHFLQQKLEDEIRQYDEELLFYAYKEIELIEGKREKDRSQFGMDASKFTEYDIVKENLITSQKIAQLASSAKYIVETILKVGVNGKKKIDNESWHYLQAIAIVLHDTTILYDYIHYDIVPYIIKISDFYEIEDIRGQERFDHQEFFRKESEIQVESARNSFINLKKTKKGNNHEVNSEREEILNLLGEIDKIFKTEYGISLINLIKILNALGRLDFFNKDYFPLTIIPEKELVKNLKEKLNEPIEESEIQEIFKFTSLDFKTYNPKEDLIPTFILRRKERLNLCPLIHLNNGTYLYGNQMCLFAAQIWSKIIDAEFPFILAQNSAISNILRKLHRYYDKQLEKQAEILAKKVLGEKNIEANIDNFRRLSLSFQSRPDCGEIDLLCANKIKKIIFLLDAKNRIKKLRPYDIRQEMKEFFEGDDSYLAKLLKKEQFVINNLKEILKHFSIQDMEEWQVQKAFVVKANYPSAYTPNQNIDFVLVDNLGDYLK